MHIFSDERLVVRDEVEIHKMPISIAFALGIETDSAIRRGTPKAE